MEYHFQHYGSKEQEIVGSNSVWYGKRFWMLCLVGVVPCEPRSKLIGLELEPPKSGLDVCNGGKRVRSQTLKVDARVAQTWRNDRFIHARSRGGAYQVHGAMDERKLAPVIYTRGDERDRLECNTPKCGGTLGSNYQQVPICLGFPSKCRAQEFCKRSAMAAPNVSTEQIEQILRALPKAMKKIGAIYCESSTVQQLVRADAEELKRFSNGRRNRMEDRKAVKAYLKWLKASSEVIEAITPDLLNQTPAVAKPPTNDIRNYMVATRPRVIQIDEATGGVMAVQASGSGLTEAERANVPVIDSANEAMNVLALIPTGQVSIGQLTTTIRNNWEMTLQRTSSIAVPIISYAPFVLLLFGVMMLFSGFLCILMYPEMLVRWFMRLVWLTPRYLSYFCERLFMQVTLEVEEIFGLGDGAVTTMKSNNDTLQQELYNSKRMGTPFNSGLSPANSLPKALKGREPRAARN